MSVQVRVLTPADTAAFHALRAEALVRVPFAFGASPEDDRARTLDGASALLAPSEHARVYGAFDAGRLVGITALVRRTAVKTRHKADVYSVYVTESARRRGVARSLLCAAIAEARGWGLEQLMLAVSERTPGAEALYRSLGFVRWGTEPRAIVWHGGAADEQHMCLDLTRTPPA